VTFALQLVSPGPRPRPFIKWVGGKQALAQHLVGHFPLSFGRYFEPFLGGGSVFFELAPARATLADHNTWLLDTWEAVRDDWQAVARCLDAMENTREDYLRYRAVDPSSLRPAARAAHFIYLNKTGFRGLFRVNRQGRFNVPYGAYDRRYYDADNLRDVARVLHGVAFRRGDFELALDGIGTGDFVYFDPPYYKLGGYSDFNRYTSDQFREGDHVRLAALCRELDARGIRWAVSNSDTAFVRDLFRGFRAVDVEARREINLKSGDRNVRELLVTNA
jgi:DNA adenine methylase